MADLKESTELSERSKTSLARTVTRRQDRRTREQRMLLLQGVLGQLPWRRASTALTDRLGWAVRKCASTKRCEVQETAKSRAAGDGCKMERPASVCGEREGERKRRQRETWLKPTGDGSSTFSRLLSPCLSLPSLRHLSSLLAPLLASLSVCCTVCVCVCCSAC